jgi:hypothetical protein
MQAAWDAWSTWQQLRHAPPPAAAAR